MIYIINQQYLTIFHIAKKKLRSGAFLSNRRSFNLMMWDYLYIAPNMFLIAVIHFYAGLGQTISFKFNLFQK